MTTEPTILLLDHDPMLREVTAKMLTRRGGQVQAAGSLPEAVLHARSHLFDVAVLDVDDASRASEMLSEMSCLSRRVVVCTPEPLPEAEAEKIWAVIQKPFDFEELVSAIFGPVGQRRRPSRSGMFPRMRAGVRTPRRAARGRRGHG